MLSTSSLDRLSLYKVWTELLSWLNYLWVLGSTIYIFIHEKKIKAKSVQWKSRAKQKLIVDYDSYYIYQIYLEKIE